VEITQLGIKIIKRKETKLMIKKRLRGYDKR
jgi:hypothetical protein